MIVRLWRTDVDLARAHGYDEFACDVSAPMLMNQPGCVGVLFLRSSARCVVATFWEDTAAIEALERSASYRETVDRILATGFLTGEQTIEVFSVRGGFLRDSMLRNFIHEESS